MAFKNYIFCILKIPSFASFLPYTLLRRVKKEAGHEAYFLLSEAKHPTK